MYNPDNRKIRSEINGTNTFTSATKNDPKIWKRRKEPNTSLWHFVEPLEKDKGKSSNEKLCYTALLWQSLYVWANFRFLCNVGSAFACCYLEFYWCNCMASMCTNVMRFASFGIENAHYTASNDTNKNSSITTYMLFAQLVPFPLLQRISTICWYSGRKNMLEIPILSSLMPCICKYNT